MDICKFPKVDLHCHLDGSIDIDFVRKVTGASDIASLRSNIQVRDDCSSLTEYLKKFETPLKCMLTTENIENAAYSFVKGLIKDNVKYVEVRFAPMLLMQSGLSANTIIESVLTGLRKARLDFAIESNVIVCGMRHFSTEQNIDMFRIAREYLGEGICAVDLAGDESKYPMNLFNELFREAVRLDLPFTIHAGECNSVQNIYDAIKLGAKRIGHGIAMRGHSDLQQLCAKKQIGVEMCPLSNLQTKAVVDKSDYPIREFIQNNLCVTVNTDNRTVSNTTLTKEFQLLVETFGFAEEELRELTRNAIICSFANDGLKNRLLKII